MGLVPISQVANMKPKAAIDVVGVCKEVGEVQMFTSRTTNKEFKKRDPVLIDISDAAVTLTIWGEDAVNFDGQVQPVILVKGARNNEFNGGKSLSLGNGSNMKINPDIPEGYKLRGWFDNGGGEYIKNSVSAHASAIGGSAEWRTFLEAHNLEVKPSSIKHVLNRNATKRWLTSTVPHHAQPFNCVIAAEDTAGDIELLKTDALKTTHNIPKGKLLLAIDHPTDAERSTSCDDEDVTEQDLYGLPLPNVDVGDIIDSTLAITLRKPSKIEEALDLCIERLACTSYHINNKQKLRYLVDLDHSDFNETTGRHNDDQLTKTDVAKIMGKSSMVSGLEKLKELPSVVNTRKRRELNKIERSKTKGKDWFNMSAPETTEEVENDLKILKMRSVLDSKHFYKKNDLKVLPKYFQVGTVQYSPLYDRECDVRKHKRRSLMDELLADSEAQMYTKRKYNEIVKRKENYAHREATKAMRKLKKNN
ncbi:uncharacterized protein ACN427_013096 [Glossina fuscipes fuscipes]